MVGACQITLPGVISATVEPLVLQGTISPSVTAPRYPGPYDVTPAADAQALATKGLVMDSDVTVGGMGEAIEKAGKDAIRTVVDGSYAGEYRDEEVTFVKYGAFGNCQSLTRLDLPNAEVCDTSFCSGCTGLVSVNLPKLAKATTTSPQTEFSGCSSLEKLVLPKMTFFSWHMLWNCTSLRLVDWGVNTIFGDYSTCTALETLIYRTTARVPSMGSVSSLSNTPIASGTGYIYVPRALVDKYKVATNWSVYADQIRAIEDYPEICDPE